MSRVVVATYTNSPFMMTEPVFQYDDGAQYLKFSGIELPESYRVDFSNYIDSHESVSVLGDADGVVIPTAILANGRSIFAFYVAVDENSTTTTYRVEIPVIKRPEPSDFDPDPEEQRAIGQLMGEVNQLKDDIGDLSDLETEDKSNLVAAINEAAQSGGGGGGGSVSPYTSNPAELGTASPGSVNKYSRGDHVHPLPTASAIGAISAPSSPATGAFLVWDGSAWVAQTLSTWQGGSY